MKMKLLISLILIASTSFIGCGKDSGGGGAPATTSNNNNPLPSDTTLCANARYQSGRWFDYNGVELPQCRNIQNYMNSKYLQSYDNNNCMSRKYNDKPTIHVILHGINMCAAEEYFKEFGNTNIQPQYGHTHYIGYPPASYYSYHNMAYPNGSFGHDGSKIGGGYWPEFGGGTYCYGWGCDIGDGEWNFGDFAAIALGAGLIFAIAN